MLLMLVTAATVLTGAAAQPRPGARGLPQVFISPAGEPFRTPDKPYPSRQWFDGADRDSDGRLTLAEMVADADRFFATLDSDRDNRIGGVEIEHYERRVAPEVAFGTSTPMGGPPPGPPPGGMPPGGGPGGMPGGGPEGMPPGMEGGPMSRAPPRPDRMPNMPRGAGLFSFFNIPHPVLRADVDLSGSSTRDEMRAWVRTQFLALDEKRQGFLTLSDLPQTPVQRRRGRLPRPR